MLIFIMDYLQHYLFTKILFFFILNIMNKDLDNSNSNLFNQISNLHFQTFLRNFSEFQFMIIHDD